MAQTIHGFDVVTDDIGRHHHLSIGEFSPAERRWVVSTADLEAACRKILRHVEAAASPGDDPGIGPRPSR